MKKKILIRKRSRLPRKRLAKLKRKRRRKMCLLDSATTRSEQVDKRKGVSEKAYKRKFGRSG